MKLSATPTSHTGKIEGILIINVNRIITYGEDSYFILWNCIDNNLKLNKAVKHNGPINSMIYILSESFSYIIASSAKTQSLVAYPFFTNNNQLKKFSIDKCYANNINCMVKIKGTNRILLGQDKSIVEVLIKKNSYEVMQSISVYPNTIKFINNLEDEIFFVGNNDGVIGLYDNEYSKIILATQILDKGVPVENVVVKEYTVKDNTPILTIVVCTRSKCLIYKNSF